MFNINFDILTLHPSCARPPQVMFFFTQNLNGTGTRNGSGTGLMSMYGHWYRYSSSCSVKTSTYKKVLLRERKRHTDRGVSSTTRWGTPPPVRVPPLVGVPPQPGLMGGGYPRWGTPQSGYPSVWTWLGYSPPPTWTWLGYPPYQLDLPRVPPPPPRCGQTESSPDRHVSKHNLPSYYVPVGKYTVSHFSRSHSRSSSVWRSHKDPIDYGPTNNITTHSTIEYSPATTHDVSRVFKCGDFVTPQSYFTTTWYTLSLSNVSGHCSTFSGQQGFAVTTRYE